MMAQSICLVMVEFIIIKDMGSELSTKSKMYFL